MTIREVGKSGSRGERAPVILSGAKGLGAAYAKDEILRFAQDDGRCAQDDGRRDRNDQRRARDDEGQARDAIHIVPAPTEDEAAAIVAALLLAEPVAGGAHATEQDSPWAMAGRRAARRGLDGGAAMGWGRPDGRRR